jgi:hypothetical protein
MHLSAPCYYFIPPGSKYSPQHPVPKHPRSHPVTLSVVAVSRILFALSSARRHDDVRRVEVLHLVF